MNEQWPPYAANLTKDFKDAHDVEKNQADKPPEQIVSKVEIDALKEQRAKPASELHLTPEGSRPSRAPDPELEKRIQKLTERLNASKGKPREDFGRSM